MMDYAALLAAARSALASYPDAADPEDAAAEAVSRLLDRPSPPSRPRAWVAVVARRICADRHRRHVVAVRRYPEAVQHQADIEDVRCRRQEAADRVREIRQIAADILSPAEIAAVFHPRTGDPSRVRVRRHRAISKLRAALGVSG